MNTRQKWTAALLVTAALGLSAVAMADFGRGRLTPEEREKVQKVEDSYRPLIREAEKKLDVAGEKVEKALADDSTTLGQLDALRNERQKAMDELRNLRRGERDEIGRAVGADGRGRPFRGGGDCSPGSRSGCGENRPRVDCDGSGRCR